jgi:hypothetical protein
VIPHAPLSKTMPSAKTLPSTVDYAPRDSIASRNADLTPSALTDQPTLTVLEIKTPTSSVSAATTDVEVAAAKRDAKANVTNAETPMRLSGTRLTRASRTSSPRL